MRTQYAASKVALGCPVCEGSLRISAAKGRKSQKPFLMLVCPQDGRHFRGFVNDRTFVAQVLARLEGPAEAAGGAGEADILPNPGRRSRTKLEREGTA